ncbi:MAG: hypothetical protein GEU73_15195 [Chloroflexi bacterium]|nr:hypothetical protein [Chloroflexota bacterium]
MDIGTLVLMVGMSYGLGVLWYDLLPGKLPGQAWRVAAYPFIGIFVAETWLPQLFAADPSFGGIHLVTAFVGSLVAVIADWIITQARRPAYVAHMEPRAEARAA